MEGGGKIMSLKYYKLFDLLQRRGMKRTDLLAFISSPTLARIGKGESITTEIINRICSALGVQPGEIMEYVEE
jgi:DNA-binding Xre family transcriptional regulator